VQGHQTDARDCDDAGIYNPSHGRPNINIVEYIWTSVFALEQKAKIQPALSYKVRSAAAIPFENEVC
jgi:hypothetical protein